MTGTPSLSYGTFEFYTSPESYSIEQIARLAVEQGEFSPGAEARLQWLMLSRDLTERDRNLVCLLQDAIATGYVRPVGRASRAD
ncbi:MAG TPA: hypothetical protein V6C57_00610 [Coleofasciculaceae cyanobacterium]